MSDLKQLPTIADAERSALVEQLLGQIEHLLEENGRQAEIIQKMRDEIAVLKGQKAKPKFKPSGMESGADETDGNGDSDDGDGDGADRKTRKRRPGSSKRSKTEQLVIHETIKVAPRAPIPQGSRLQGLSRLHRARSAHRGPQYLLSPGGLAGAGRNTIGW